jgi:exodeoxyribonuclease V gamma subunit
MRYAARLVFLLYRSNRVERLADALADVVQTPLADPFARECIVVQGPGMERWLSMRLSERLGVWANPWFPFPRTLIELSLDAYLGEATDTTARYQPDALTLLIARMLPELSARPAFSEVARYVDHDPREDKLITLSRRLARTLDQYIVYRPDWVLSWERGQEAHFQAELWRAIVAELGPGHLAQRIAQLEIALTAGTPKPASFPQRVHVFGISTLPPAFLGVLAGLSQQIDVHLHLLTATPEYFGDLDREVAQGSDVSALLANLGKVNRELIDLLAPYSYHEPRSDLFELPGTRVMLHGLLTDLAQLTARDASGQTGERPLEVREHDASISVHVCHSPARELEVLREQLRARFEADHTLKPSDVVVLTPDIERYASAIEAVMSVGDPSDTLHIPYRVADRRTARRSEVCEAFFALLRLCTSRLYISDVLDFLQRPAVRERFAIEEVELERARAWLVDAGARWAIDAAQRTSVAQPPFEEGTLRLALDRLLVGYAAKADCQEAVLGVHPFSDVEGRESLLLGRLVACLETLFSLCRNLSAPRSALQWAQDLPAALDKMLDGQGERAIDHHLLRSVLAELSRQAEEVRLLDPLSIAALLSELEARIDPTRDAQAFLGGGVTFCEHVPMRALPFRVVCMVGLDDESFPRRAPKPSFDRMVQKPRPGDRSLRDDDKQLFLEALLSARDALIITYVGRSAKDDGVRPPSVVLDQLMRVIDRHFVVVGKNRSLSLLPEAKAASAIKHEHALLRFDPRYFHKPKDPVFFSYDQAACALARSYYTLDRRERCFVPEAVPISEPVTQLKLDELVRFFRLPAQAFSERRLRVMLPRDIDPTKDREPIVLDGLEAWQVGERLLARDESELSDAELRAFQQQALLPPGARGRYTVRTIEAIVAKIVSASPSVSAARLVPVDLQIGHIHVLGRLDHVYGDTRVERTYSTVRAKHTISAWIRHLAWCATCSSDRPTTLLIGRQGKAAELTRFAFVPDALALLEDLLALYVKGQEKPLPLFNEASATYIEQRAKDRSHEDALSAAQNAGSSKGGGADSELDNLYLRMVFRASELADLTCLDTQESDPAYSFTALAQRVWLPLLKHAHTEKVT